jgi:pyruvate/2-oxoglutarate dehydrogenase complex dihydrolipoamide dehydrogenase (E3) component
MREPSKPVLNVDVCVLGAGAAGLSAASGAAQLGLSVVLFEEGQMGGDCLNTGCVPSKALIAAAKAAHAMGHAQKLGIANAKPVVDWTLVRKHIEGVIAHIAPVDSQERFEGLGCTVIREHAAFIDRDTVECDSALIKARQFVVATGAQAFVPPIPGLAETPFLTNESVFHQDTLPDSLIVLGGGVIGVELGQAFARLGVAVTIIEAQAIMGGQEPEAVEAVRKALQADGVDVREGVKAVGVKGNDDQVSITLEDGQTLSAHRLLVAVGRAARVDNIGLDAAGIAWNRKGLEVNDSLRSVSNSKVWALGDVAGREQLTHAAGFHAGVFVKNALFKASFFQVPGTAKVAHMPAVAYCEPEVARIGLSEAQAREQFGDTVKVTRADFEENDRALTERSSVGFCKLIIGKGGKLLGATIVGDGAGEAIQLVGLAMANKKGVGALTALISPYPTRGEIVKRAAGAYYTPTLFSPRTRKLINVLKHLG